MNEQNYEYVVVGSGAGGATVARELGKAGKNVLVIEKGKNESKIGTFLDALRFYDANKITRIPTKSKEGVILWRVFMSCGTTMVSMANGVRCLQKELNDYGLDLEDEFKDAESELNIKPIPDSLLSEGGLRIREASRMVGHPLTNMPKFLEAERCKRCGHCSLGCKYNAKWTTYNYLKEAQQFDTEVLYDSEVIKVLVENGKVRGVRVANENGNKDIRTDNVILSAGGLGSPVILQKSGISNAGTHLFIDLIINTYAKTPDFSIMHEPQMSLINHEYHQDRGFIISTCINSPPEVRLMELGIAGFSMPTKRLVGIMTKIADDATGRIYPDGSVSKKPSIADQEKLSEGTQIAKEILIKAGAEPKTIRYSIPQGAHPGGTAAMGRIVNNHLETEIKNLYVCDASVLPKSPGLPPILTIIALGKRLSKELIAH